MAGGDFKTLPGGMVAFGPLANCTLALCPIEYSILRYQPNIPANAIFIAVFGISLLVHAWQGVRSRMWGFAASMISGCILEIIGYGGRLIIHENPFAFGGFLMQIICITIAPVFYCSAIYVMLSQVINFVDASLSRFKPQLFYWIFIPCDIVSLILQATGGALSCVGGTKAAVEVGERISLAGLIFQVITLIIFCGLFADYVNKAAKSPSRHRLTKNMTFFLVFLFLATFFILIRCAYRIAELQAGYFSAIFRDEGLFIGLESCVMCVATVLLNIGHPAAAFKENDYPKEAGPPFEELANGNHDNISMSDMGRKKNQDGQIEKNSVGR